MALMNLAVSGAFALFMVLIELAILIGINETPPARRGRSASFTLGLHQNNGCRFRRKYRLLAARLRPH